MRVFFFLGVMFVILYILCVFAFGLNVKRSNLGSSKCPFHSAIPYKLIQFLFRNIFFFVSLHHIVWPLRWLIFANHRHIISYAYFMTKRNSKVCYIPIIVPTTKCAVYNEQIGVDEKKIYTKRERD